MRLLQHGRTFLFHNTTRAVVGERVSFTQCFHIYLSYESIYEKSDEEADLGDSNLGKKSTVLINDR